MTEVACHTQAMPYDLRLMLRRAAPVLVIAAACQPGPPAAPIVDVAPPPPPAPPQAAAPPRASAAPAVEPDPARVALALGHAFGCLLDAGGAVHCWGSNEFGQLGGEGLTGVLAIAAGPEHACAVRANGYACWGRNDRGQLGDGTRDHRRRPVAVRALGALGDWTDRDKATMALTRDSSCFFWSEEYSGSFAACTGALRGADAFSLSGRGRAPPCKPRTLCDKVHGVRGAAYDTTLCTLSADAIPPITCPNGPAALVPIQPAPIEDDRSEDIDTLVLGRTFACGLQYDGDVACWGSNARGQLGRMEPGWSQKPLFVPALRRAQRICAGADHACALDAEGRVRCWGDARRGQLGVTDIAAGVPVEIEAATGASAIGCGEAHACAAFTDGRVLCWGANEAGQATGGPRSAIAAPAIVTTRR